MPNAAPIGDRPTGQMTPHLRAGTATVVDIRSASNAKGRPPGAVDVAQCGKWCRHLDGVIVNQVGGARIALAHNTGGSTAVSAVTIVEEPGSHGG
ncbi:hypothetical protein [Mycolicibacterium sp.]|uniref:hypothetical protein n=1 Tax=Mycolicibacterium sp. TaxID=2320850 RepID=UPI003D14BAC1